VNDTGTTRATGLALGALLLLGCGPRELRVTMNDDNHSGQEGFAVITQLAQGLRIEVETSFPDIDAPQPAHIHTGTCGEVGDKVFGLTAPVAIAGKPGRFGSVTVIDAANLESQKVDQKYLKLEALLASPHLINVHDARDTGIYVSCGEIRE
jgi:hypothetical protein